MSELAPAPATTPAACFCPGCGTRCGDASLCAACSSPRLPKPSLAGHLRPIHRTLALYFVLLAVCVGIALASLAGLGRTTVDQVNLEIAGSVAISLVVLGACLVGRRDIQPVLACVGSPRWFALAPLLSLLTFAFASAVCAGAAALFHLHRHTEVPSYQTAGFPWWTPIVLISLQPGIFEELAFRGLIMSWLGRVLGRRETITASALLFATLHLNPIMFIHTTVMGVVLGVLRQRTGSLYPGMLVHACHNGLVILTSHAMELPR
jgi:membrane protease YdiL (CAAX protease family)